MEGTFLPQLCAAHLSSNLLEAGDHFFVTTEWRNTGTGTFSGKGRIAVDLEFGGQRHYENNEPSFRFVWAPYPDLWQWEPQQFWSTTGRWDVPSIWGGSFDVYVSLLDDQNNPLPFIGKGGKRVSRQHLCEIDVDFSPGNEMVARTRKPLTIVFTPHMQEEGNYKEKEIILEERFGFAEEYPALTRFGTFSYASVPPVVTFRRTEENRLSSSFEKENAVFYRLEQENDRTLRYHMNAAAASCDVVFSVDETGIACQVEAVKEADGWELIGIYFPRLLCGGKTSKLLDPFCGGRLVEVANALPLGARHSYDVCNFGAVYDEKTAAVVQPSNLEALLYQSVQQKGRHKLGVIGVEVKLRVAADREGMPSIPVKGEQGFRLSCLQQAGWQEIAQLVRRQIHGKKVPVYDRCILYKIMIDAGQNRKEEEKEIVTLAQVREIIRQTWAITDGAPQVVYLVGWQENGHDSEYPNPHLRGFNPRAGTAGEFRALAEECKKYNAVLSLHDNFDDAYLLDDTDIDLIARDKRGELYKGWIWSGGMSYILSPKRYVSSGVMRERVRRMVEAYGLEKTYHIDVLTSEVRRYDFSSDMLAAADENLRYKKAIVEEFNRYGIDVTSETLAMPFVGVTGYSWSSRDNSKEMLFPNEERIPLTAMLYHGECSYNIPSLTDEGILQGIAYGGQNGWGDVLTLTTAHVRSYYLHGIPMSFLARRPVKRFEADNRHVFADYGDGYSAAVNFETGSYEVKVNGRTVGKDWVTFAPGNRPGTYLAFAGEEGVYRFAAPQGWKAAKAVALTVGGADGELPCSIENGEIILRLPANTPLRIEAINQVKEE